MKFLIEIFCNNIRLSNQVNRYIEYKRDHVNAEIIWHFCNASINASKRIGNSVFLFAHVSLVSQYTAIENMWTGRKAIRKLRYHFMIARRKRQIWSSYDYQNCNYSKMSYRRNNSQHCEVEYSRFPTVKALMDWWVNHSSIINKIVRVGLDIETVIANFLGTYDSDNLHKYRQSN